MFNLKKIGSILLFFILVGFSKYPGDWYVKDYYVNGTLKTEGWLLKSQKTGYWYTYYINGKVESEGYYDSNNKNAFWKEYFDNGKLKKEVNYKNGKKDGWEKSYNLKGNLTHIGKYSEDKKDYFWKHFENDKIVNKEEWNNGFLLWKIEYKYNSENKGVYFYYKDYKLLKEGTFIILNNKIKYFDNKGNKQFEEVIENVSK